MSSRRSAKSTGVGPQVDSGNKRTGKRRLIVEQNSRSRKRLLVDDEADLASAEEQDNDDDEEQDEGEKDDDGIENDASNQLHESGLRNRNRQNITTYGARGYHKQNRTLDRDAEVAEGGDSDRAGSIQEDENLLDRDREEDEVVTRMAKKLVFMVLAAEQSRGALRRQTIHEKVLENTHKRRFNVVFNKAQQLLQTICGLTMVELPSRSAAPNSNKKRKVAMNRKTKKLIHNSYNKSYIVASCLAPEYRSISCLVPSRLESIIYSGIVTALCSIIYLNGGYIHEAQLKKYLKELRISNRTPYEDQTLEQLLTSMVKQLYLEKIKDDDGLDSNTVWTYTIGPRARTELSEDIIVQFVARTYGDKKPDNFENRIMKAIQESAHKSVEESAINNDHISDSLLPTVGQSGTGIRDTNNSNSSDESDNSDDADTEDESEDSITNSQSDNENEQDELTI
ncbi:MAGE family-domain-containing protein [Dipodascopsis uninucleata]